jgi:TolB-like protein
MKKSFFKQAICGSCRIFIIALLFASAFPLAAQTTSKPKLAVLPFSGGTGNDGDTIALLLSNRDEIRNAFTIVPRTSNVDSIMKEQEIQRSGLTDSDTISQLGKQLNADFVVAGHIQKLGDRNLVLITIINVETLQQIAGDYREYKNITEVRGFLPDMAKKLAHASLIDTSKLPKLAVVPFDIPNKDVNVQDAETLAQLLATEIANSGKYAVLPRTKVIETAMKEQKIQRSGLTDPSSMKAIGRATNAKYVLSGTVTSLGGSMNLFFAQILNVEDASLLVGRDVEYTTIADGLQQMSELSQLLTGASKDTNNSTNQPATSGTNTQSATTHAPAAPLNQGLQFSTGRKIGAGFLNLAFGAGSFTLGDWGGGLISLAGHAVGWGVSIYGMSQLANLDNTYTETSNFDGQNTYTTSEGATPAQYDEAGAYLAIGMVINLGVAIFDFVQPFTYDRRLAQKNSGYHAALNENPLEHINVSYAPQKTGAGAVNLSFRYRW